MTGLQQLSTRVKVLASQRSKKRWRRKPKLERRVRVKTLSGKTRRKTRQRRLPRWAAVTRRLPATLSARPGRAGSWK